MTTASQGLNIPPSRWVRKQQLLAMDHFCMEWHIVQCACDWFVNILLVGLQIYEAEIQLFKNLLYQLPASVKLKFFFLGKSASIIIDTEKKTILAHCTSLYHITYLFYVFYILLSNILKVPVKLLF